MREFSGSLYVEKLHGKVFYTLRVKAELQRHIRLQTPPLHVVPSYVDLTCVTTTLAQCAVVINGKIGHEIDGNFCYWLEIRCRKG